jgi:hypothetical protein
MPEVQLGEFRYYKRVYKRYSKRTIQYSVRQNQEVTITNKIYLTADDISDALGVSKAFAYKMIKKLNTELTAQGYLTITGKVSTKYFSEKVYGFNSAEGGDDRAGIPRQ